MLINYIFHLSDLHLGSAAAADFAYRRVFDDVCEQLRLWQHRSETAVVVTGDIFHHKNKMSAEDVDDFYYLFDRLTTLVSNVVIIPGNHDTVINNHTKMDLITPLAARYSCKILHYIRDTEVRTIGGRRFYHVSVFDTADTSDILSKIKTMPDCILLYHGMVDGCIFGTFRAHKCKISVEIMQAAAICMLGDIHQHQFIIPTAAYPGSLIQQNIQESVEKGYILWDLNNKIGAFMNVRTGRPFVKINVASGSINYNSEHLKDARSVDVVVSDDSKICREDIEAAVGCKISTLRVMKQYAAAHCGEASQINVIKHQLSAGGVLETTIDKITSLHSELYAKYNTMRTVSWSITRIEWSNLFRYGRGNFIDFSSSQGICGLMAPNMTGKSAILDILTFALFNESMRGDKKSIIHLGEKNSAVKVDFMCSGGRKYTIYREDTRTKNIKILLLEHSAELSKNITGSTVDETYKIMRGLIGEIEEFKSTAMCNQDGECDIVKMGKAVRRDLFVRLFGISNLDGIIKHVKDEYKLLNEKLLSVQRPLPLIDSRTAAEFDSEIIAVSAKLTAAEKYIGVFYTQDQISVAEAQLTILKQKYADLSERLKDKPLRSTPAGISAGSAAAEFAKIAAVLPKMTVTAATESLTQHQQSKYSAASRKDLVCKVISNMKVAVGLFDKIGVAPEFNNTKFSARDFNDQIKMWKQETANSARVQKAPLIPAAAISADLQRAAAEVLSASQLLRMSLHTITDTATLESAAASMKSTSTYKFNDSCDCCNNNIVVLNAELGKTLEKLRQVKQLNAAAEIENIKITEQIVSAENKYKQLTAAAEYYRQFSAIDSKLQDMNRLLIRHQEEYELAAAAEAHAEQQKPLREFLRLHQQMIDAAGWENYCAHNKMMKMAAEISGLELKLAEMREYIAREDRDINVDYAAEVKKYSRQLGELTARKSAAEIYAEALLMYEKNYAEIFPKHETYRIYLECLSNKNVQSMLIASNIEHICSRVNDILAAMGLTFSINPIINNFIEFNISDTKHGTLLPLDLASGFQKFVISIVFRLVLTSVLPYSASFIMIDEGFGCMDKTNIQRIGALLNCIKKDYNFILLVSHIDELNSILEYPIPISFDANYSYIAAGNNINSEVIVSKESTTITEPPKPAEQKFTIAVDYVDCSCGRRIKKASARGHMRTKFHIDNAKIEKNTPDIIK